MVLSLERCRGMRMADVVRVVEEKAALSEPVFLIEQNGKLYLTLAVWEYDDTNQDALSDAQCDGVKGIRELHETIRKESGSFEAVVVDVVTGVAFAHTGISGTTSSSPSSPPQSPPPP